MKRGAGGLPAPLFRGANAAPAASRIATFEICGFRAARRSVTSAPGTAFAASVR